MIRQIRGIAADVHPAHVVIDVQGVGYLIYTTAASTYTLGAEITLYTHLAVRENALDLYGFATRDELAFFEELLTLPKIGPKSALQILSQASLQLLQQSIASQDHVHLSKMSGISKKTAEKIVLGLKDAYEGYALTGVPSSELSENQAAFISDAIDALITLGYPQADARKAVQSVLPAAPGIQTANEAIKEALKLLG